MGSPSSSSSTLTSTSSPVLNGLDDRLLLARDDVGRRTRNDDDVDSKGMWDNHDADDLRQGAGADIGYDGYLDERVYAQRASRNDNKTTLRITKGKAKAREQDYGEDHAFSSASSEERPEFPPEAGDEDEREAKRIADNLAAWSRAEVTRRKTLRKNAPQLVVLPTAPPLPSASTLARRSSALIRAGSKRVSRASKPHFGSEEIQDLPPPENRTPTRRHHHHQRTSSYPLQERKTSIDSPGRRQHVRTTVPAESTTFQGATSDSNPFASRPSSFVRGPSTDSFGGPTSSRFIEDLPLQSPTASPTKAKNPFHGGQPMNSTLWSSTKSSTTTASSSPLGNPFSDSHAAAVTERSSPDDPDPGLGRNGGDGAGGGHHRQQRPRTDTLDSQHTIRAGDSRDDDHDHKHDHVPFASDESGAKYDERCKGQRRGEFDGDNDNGAAESTRTSPFRDPAYKRYNDDEEQEDEPDDVEEEEEEEEDDDRGGPVGWLGWIFCGCFGDPDRHGDEQTGKTNPMA